MPDSVTSGPPAVTGDLDALPTAVRALIRRTGHLYAGEKWLRVEEAVAADPPFYTWEEDADGAVAFAAAYRFDAASNPWPYARLDLFLRQHGLGDEDRGAVLPHHLIGGRRPGHSRILFAGPRASRAALLTRLIGTAAEAAAARGAATLAALYCDDGDTELAAAFAAHGGVRVPSYTDFALDLPGSGFDDWLASLPRKRRYAEIADERKLAAGDVRYSVAPPARGDVDWIVPLELELYTKYGNDYLVEEARALHLAYIDHLGDDALLIRAERAGRPVGFVSLVRSGDSAFVRQAGFDDEACAGVPVYFGAVFHTAIRWAYEHDVSTLDYSISARAVKVRRGCRPLGRCAWIVPLSGRAGEVLRALTPVTPEE